MGVLERQLDALDKREGQEVVRYITGCNGSEI